MSYAYWNPALREQSHLVNAQTGTTDAVRVEAVEPVPIEFRGQPVHATGFRLVGPKEPLTVWYGPDGDWIGLDATVEWRPPSDLPDSLSWTSARQDTPVRTTRPSRGSTSQS